MSAGAIASTPFTSAGLSGSAGSAASRSHSTRSADWACAASKSPQLRQRRSINTKWTGFIIARASWHSGIRGGTGLTVLRRTGGLQTAGACRSRNQRNALVPARGHLRRRCNTGSSPRNSAGLPAGFSAMSRSTQTRFVRSRGRSTSRSTNCFRWSPADRGLARAAGLSRDGFAAGSRRCRPTRRLRYLQCHLIDA